MLKLLPCLLVILLLLASCGGSAGVAGVHADTPDVPEPLSSVPPAEAAPEAGAATGTPVSLEALDIAGVAFNDLNNNRKAEYAFPDLIEEFRSLILKQTYTAPTGDWGKYYEASLLDKDGHVLLKLFLGEKNVSFDRDVQIGGSLYEKQKTYETDEWLNEYMFRLTAGSVLQPSHLKYPAGMRIPPEYYSVEMLNKGSAVVNKYETLTRLHALIEKSLMNREVEITGSEHLYSAGDVQAEMARQDGARVIRFTCASPDSFINISSENAYNGIISTGPLSLYRDAGKSGVYRLAAERGVLAVRLDEAFDRAFEELFESDSKTSVRLKAADVEKLIKEKKPWVTDYIFRNLGMEQWNSRLDDALEKKNAVLGGGSRYTLLGLKNSHGLRLMLFSGETGAFKDYIDFGRWYTGTEYTIERAGDYAWIAGNTNRGHGTGESIDTREWYTVDGSGKKLALSIPYDSYIVGPDEGTLLKADAIRLEKDDPVRLKADYSVTRVYMLDIPEADENGWVKVTARKEFEFAWDAKERVFISALPASERGFTEIDAECPEITEKCGILLEKEYDGLLEGIEAADSIGEPQRDMKLGAYGQFLKDCPDSAKKAALAELLSEKS